MLMELADERVFPLPSRTPEELILEKAIQESDDKDIQLTDEEKEEKRRDIERSFNESLNYLRR